jgi:hypothetical protein
MAAATFVQWERSEMFILQIEHTVPDFDGWKKEGFDRDPIGRQQGGVRRYRISRPVDDSRYVVIDLEFDSSSEAEAFLTALRDLWGRVQGRFGWTERPRARIMETVESKEY